MTVNITALKTECTTDPSGIGLVALWNAGQNNSLVDALNISRVTIQLRPATLKRSDVVGAIDPTDLPGSGAAPSAQDENRQRWLENGILSDENVPNTAEVRSFVGSSVAGSSLIRLNALTAAVDSSRAQELFAANVTLTQIRAARLA